MEDGSINIQVRKFPELPEAVEIRELNGKHVERLTHHEVGREGLHVNFRWIPERDQEGVYELHVLGRSRSLWPLDVGQPAIDDTPHVVNSSARIDRAHDRVIWTPQHTSLARVLGKLRSGMFICTVKSWHFTAPVRHHAAWDYWDKERVAHYRANRSLRASLLEIPLPPQLLVVGTPGFAQYRHHAYFRDWDIDLEDFTFSIESTSGQAKAHDAFPDQPVPIVGPDDELIITMDDSSREHLHNHPFGVYVYLNGELLMKEPLALDPWRFTLPHRMAPANSLQLLTVNVLDHHGGIGGKSTPIWYVNTGE